MNTALDTVTDPGTGRIRVVGVDPGPIPGVVMLTERDRFLQPSVFQCDPESAGWLVRSLLTGARDNPAFTPGRLHAGMGLHCPICMGLCRIDQPAVRPSRVVLAIERFVIGMRSARVSTSRASAITRDMVGMLMALGRNLPNVVVVTRCAGEVLPWATDKRLSAAGLYDVTKGMPHARAAARHALFAATAAGMPDPLSTKVGAR